MSARADIAAQMAVYGRAHVVVTRTNVIVQVEAADRMAAPLPLHRTEAGYPRCGTCDGGGCPDCTDPA